MSISNIYTSEDIVIDPRLPAPPDIIGVHTGIPDELASDGQDPYGAESADPIETGESYDGYSIPEIGVGITPDMGAPVAQEDYRQNPPPTKMEVVSQTVRISADGTHVVDLVVEVGDLEDDVQSVEVRSTKA